MYSFSYLEPVCWSISSSNCCFLTCIQVSQEAGQVVWYVHLFQDFPQFIVIHTVKGFGIVTKAEIDVFLELSCFFNDPVDVGNLISGSSAFSKAIFNIWKFTVHILLKPGLENFEHYFISVWDECNCAVVWAFFGITFLWDWNENWPFPVLRPLLSFPNFLTKLSCFSFMCLVCVCVCVCVCLSTQSYLTLCGPMGRSMPGSSVFYYLSEFVQIHVHWDDEYLTISSSATPSSFAFNLSQHNNGYWPLIEKETLLYAGFGAW